MNERIEVLRRLQSIDTQLQRLEGDKRYRSYDIQKKQNQIQQKRAELLKISEEIKTSQTTITMKEADLKSRRKNDPDKLELGARLVPIVGRVTMDFTMVVPEIPCAVGDVATIYGGLVSLDEQARRANTISYDLLTSLGARVDRWYR